MHDPYFMMTIMTRLSLMDYLRFQGNLNKFGLSLQRGLGGTPGGDPSVSLSSDATGTCRAGTSVRSPNLCEIPVGTTGTLHKELFFAVHPPHNLGRGYVGVSRVFFG